MKTLTIFGLLILMLGLPALPASGEDNEPDKEAVGEAGIPERDRGIEEDVGDAGDAAAPDTKKELQLEAQHIVYEGDSFTCTDEVVITYGASRIDCDKVVGTLAEVERTDEETGEKSKQKAITHLVATGSPIKMVSEERRVRCLKAVYDFIEGKVTLTGSKEDPPMITDKSGTIRGREIIYDINKKSFTVPSGTIILPIKGSALPGILE